MKKVFLFFLVAFSSVAQNPLWLRYPSVSPDGKFIAFSFKGDIYKVEAQGGKAVRLTTNPAYDTQPIWSPDSKKIAFVSDRDASFKKLFVVDASGGVAKQLSFHSSSVEPQYFSADSKKIFYTSQVETSAQNALFPFSRYEQLYEVSVEGGAPKLASLVPMQNINLNQNGQKILYIDVKGHENQWRKKHTSSVARDVWFYDFKSNKRQQITDFKGEDRNPVFAKNEQEFFFLSERNGSFNVFKGEISDPKKVTQLTFFKENPVRFLSSSKENLLCFSFDGEIYTLKEGENPKKINIEIQNDVDDNQIKNLNFSSGASSVAASPDGKQVAMTIRGDVFVTLSDYSTTKQITSTPEAESGLSFSPDGKTLVYSSYRNGYWDLYQATLKRNEDLNFANAMLIEEQKLIDDKTEKTFPQFSPDGKEIAFVKDRRQIAVYNLETKKTRIITDKKYHLERNGYMNFSWSPDSKWFVIQYVAREHSPYSDIGIVSAKGGEDIFNITDSGYFSLNPSWALDGEAILFKTDRYGMRNHASWGSMYDQMIVFLTQEAYDKFKMNKEEFEFYTEQEKFLAEEKKKDEKSSSKDEKSEKDKEKSDKKDKIKEIKIEFDNIDSRIVRLTPNSSNLGDAIITKDGKKLYYLSSFESGYDIWVYDLREKSTKLLNKLNGNALSFSMDKEGKNIFILGGQKMQILEIPSEKIKNISYNATFKLDLQKERQAMFSFMRNEVPKRFYVTDLHGVKWDKLCDNYQKFLPYINNNYDFADLLSEILGELNVSHTGGGYRPLYQNSQATGRLGIFATHTQKGLVVDEIVVGSPLNNHQSKVEKGVIIEEINQNKITLEEDFNQYLEGKTGQKILLSLYNPKNNERWQEVVKPISNSVWQDLLYKRWIKNRQDDVEKWSNGKLGYVHIPSMGDDSFRSVYADALGKYNQKQGMVIDIRYNGGGRLHEDIEVFFSGKKYLTQKIQGEKYGEMPSRRWNKPSIMLMCEADYSNAHGTPWVYKHLGLGKLIGKPVPGTMTTVNWVTLQDPSLYFGIPVVGYEKAGGGYLENDELHPDINADLDLDKAILGEDTQLKKAVEELMKQIN